MVYKRDLFINAFAKNENERVELTQKLRHTTKFRASIDGRRLDNCLFIISKVHDVDYKTIVEGLVSMTKDEFRKVFPKVSDKQDNYMREIRDFLESEYYLKIQ